MFDDWADNYYDEFGEDALPLGATERGTPYVQVDAAWLSEIARGAGTLPTDEFVARFRQLFAAAEAALEERDE